MGNLLEITHNLLATTSCTRADIARGAQVDIEWLNKFAQGRIVEPGVIKVQRVHDFLVAQKAA